MTQRIRCAAALGVAFLRTGSGIFASHVVSNSTGEFRCGFKLLCADSSPA